VYAGTACTVAGPPGTTVTSGLAGSRQEERGRISIAATDARNAILEQAVTKISLSLD
jgi:hypothetical protein